MTIPPITDEPSEAEVYWSQWVLILGGFAQLGKKLLCCPPSKRQPLMDHLIKVATDSAGN